MRMKGLMIGVASATLAAAANATTVWSNGNPVGDAGLCSSNAATCGSNGWTIYDDFTLSSATTVTGFTYDSDFAYGGIYSSTNWSIWTSDPRSSWASGPAYSGTLVGTNAADGIGYTTTTLTGLDVSLAAGTYWLGLQNNVSNGGITTYVYSDRSNDSASQSDNSGTFYNPDTAPMTFTVEAGAVPEPSTWAMMGLGFAALAFAQYRARKSVATAA